MVWGRLRVKAGWYDDDTTPELVREASTNTSNSNGDCVLKWNTMDQERERMLSEVLKEE